MQRGNRAHALAVVYLTGRLMRARIAIVLQRDRILSTPTDPDGNAQSEADLMMLLAVLRMLLDEAETAATVAFPEQSAAIAEARQQFDRAAPQVKALRDALIHPSSSFEGIINETSKPAHHGLSRRAYERFQSVNANLRAAGEVERLPPDGGWLGLGFIERVPGKYTFHLADTSCEAGSYADAGSALVDELLDALLPLHPTLLAALREPSA